MTNTEMWAHVNELLAEKNIKLYNVNAKVPNAPRDLVLKFVELQKAFGAKIPVDDIINTANACAFVPRFAADADKKAICMAPAVVNDGYMSPAVYGAMLHEIGHLSVNFHEEELLDELEAWRWAVKNAKMWHPHIQLMLENGLDQRIQCQPLYIMAKIKCIMSGFDVDDFIGAVVQAGRDRLCAQ